MERFPLKSSVPKPGAMYQSVYKKGNTATNGRSVHSPGEDDLVDITPGLQQAGAGDGGVAAVTTPTNHGTFQLYEHSASARNSTASTNSYIAQYFNSAFDTEGTPTKYYWRAG